MNDFADWLSPILVKELRQGMRTRSFIGIFLASQFFMIMCVLTSLGSEPDSRTTVTGFFWTVIGLAILLAMPMRGMMSLGSEIKGNTIELMLLTQLSAWRITAGKWLALILQTLLLVCAILPYVVLRYFLGGVDLVDELIGLGWMVGGSALLTALAVGLSPFMQSMVMRLCSIGAIPVGLWLTAFLVARRVMGGSTPSMSTWAWAFAVLGPLVILELFEIGVAKIAPAAENHGTRKRLIAVAICIAAVILGQALNSPGMWLSLAAFVISPCVIGALLEETVTIPSLYRPFLRWKLPGRIAGLLLYPGWASGLLFFMVTTTFCLAGASLKWGDPDVAFRVAAGFEAILLPLLVVRFFFRNVRSVLLFYFGLQVLLFVMAIVVSVNFSHENPAQRAAALLPNVGFFLHVWGNESLNSFFTADAVLAGLSLLGLFILSLKEWKKIAAVEREAASLE